MENEILKRASGLLRPGERPPKMSVPAGPGAGRRRVPRRGDLPGAGGLAVGLLRLADRPPSARRDADDAHLATTIVDIHADLAGTYGAPRVHAELRLGLGVAGAAASASRGCMRVAGLVGVCHRRKRRGHRPLPAAARGPGPAAVHRRRPGPVVVHRHHRAPHQRREGLLRRGPRRVHPPGRRLVDRRPHALRAGRRRPADGDLATPTRARQRSSTPTAAASTRPGSSATACAPPACSGPWAGSPRAWTTR